MTDNIDRWPTRRDAAYHWWRGFFAGVLTAEFLTIAAISAINALL